ncbi:aminoacyl-tRNA hydrolase [Demequina sediminicola]|uniref:aminoacyl-tRNA hydrolase n=1 Tax=Demequina sediminicola TaxID=1095026 RepID=UPI000783B828|nr:aminoacyl-tRNA hydrolase [Demequina sediminicola]
MNALVVGLGNPGEDYAGTRHNIGQMVADELAARGGTSLSVHKKSRTRAATVRIGGEPVVVAVPMTYMNVSGGPVHALANYQSVAARDVIVVHDELDIPFGEVKLKRGGGSAGHNGLKDITKALGGPDYVRVRVGIGRPPGRMDAATYVLKRFSAAERKELDLLVSRAADAVESIVADGLEAAQQVYHAPR